MTHIIINYDPFTVQYQHNGLTKIVEYQIRPTEQEIRDLYPYIIFDPVKMPVSSKRYEIWHYDASAYDWGEDELQGNRVLIGMIKARNLSDAFTQAQNDFNDDYAAFGARSTCVGDMIVDIEEGKMYIIGSTDFRLVGTREMLLN